MSELPWPKKRGFKLPALRAYCPYCDGTSLEAQPRPYQWLWGLIDPRREYVCCTCDWRFVSGANYARGRLFKAHLAVAVVLLAVLVFPTLQDFRDSSLRAAEAGRTVWQVRQPVSNIVYVVVPVYVEPEERAADPVGPGDDPGKNIAFRKVVVPVSVDAMSQR